MGRRLNVSITDTIMIKQSTQQQCELTSGLRIKFGTGFALTIYM